MQSDLRLQTDRGMSDIMVNCFHACAGQFDPPLDTDAVSNIQKGIDTFNVVTKYRYYGWRAIKNIPIG